MATQTRRVPKPATGNGSREIPATLNPDHTEISRLAYLYWLERGRPIGSPEEDWSRAEQDLRKEQAPVT